MLNIGMNNCSWYIYEVNWFSKKYFCILLSLVLSYKKIIKIIRILYGICFWGFILIFNFIFQILLILANVFFIHLGMAQYVTFTGTERCKGIFLNYVYIYIYIYCYVYFFLIEQVNLILFSWYGQFVKWNYYRCQIRRRKNSFEDLINLKFNICLSKWHKLVN